MTYDEYVAALQFLAVMQDPNGQALLNQILPQVISYAELRIYRDPELDFLATRTTDTTSITQRGIRSALIPPQFVVVEGVTLLLPANTRPTAALGVPANMERVSLLRADRDFLDTTWPIESLVQRPAHFETYYAIFSQQETAEGDDPVPLPSSFLIAPTPDNTYYAELTGTFRPAALSATNPQTFISVFLPDLMLSASMVFVAGTQKSYGQQSDDPRLAMSWEQLYTKQKQGAAVEEARKKSQSSGWSPYPPAPLANIPRTGMPMPQVPQMAPQPQVTR